MNSHRKLYNLALGAAAAVAAPAMLLAGAETAQAVPVQVGIEVWWDQWNPDTGLVTHVKNIGQVDYHCDYDATDVNDEVPPYHYEFFVRAGDVYSWTIEAWSLGVSAVPTGTMWHTYVMCWGPTGERTAVFDDIGRF